MCIEVNRSLPESVNVLLVKAMSTLRPTSAKIIQHSEGLGAVSSVEVRKRAAELAIIAGRAQYSDEDWRQAKRELHGGHETASDGDEMGIGALVSENGMVVTDVGHHTENVHYEDGENLAEELIAEGMDEAVHEQMLESRRGDQQEEKDDREES